MRLPLITYLVADYDHAIAWFTTVLGFTLLEDTPLGGKKRWVRVAAPGGGAELLLAEADGPEQRAAIGKVAGGRVGFFLRTDNFTAEHARLLGHGVRFLEAPRSEPYGTVAVFEDLYGNKWDLIEPR